MTIKWPDFKFPPINLFSKPLQEEYDKALSELVYALDQRIKTDDEIFRLLNNASELKSYSDKLLAKQKNAGQQLKDLNFIYYTRTGRFYDEKG